MQRRYIRPSISLVFRGFDLLPQQIEFLMGVKASRYGIRGEPVRPYVKTLLVNSYLAYELDAPDEECWLDGLCPALFSYLGGIKHIRNVREYVSPKHFEVNIELPIKKSEERDGGYLTEETLADLCFLGASLSFYFR